MLYRSTIDYLDRPIDAKSGVRKIPDLPSMEKAWKIRDRGINEFASLRLEENVNSKEIFLVLLPTTQIRKMPKPCDKRLTLSESGKLKVGIESEYKSEN